MASATIRKIIIDPESRGFFLGMASSITSSLITLYVAQNYLIRRASEEAAKKAITDYKREFGIMSTIPIQSKFSDWSPLSHEEIDKIIRITS